MKRDKRSSRCWRGLAVLLLMMLPLNGFSVEKINDVVKVVDGIEIPIQINLPEKGKGPFPVTFHVHGGGWNGGSENEVPPAVVMSDVDYLCDQFGIIYVGLAYRCKNQNGTFELALEDLHDSVNWFKERAGGFNADMSRVGFSGASAGAPLSAMMAQQVPSCTTYLGLWGVYDLMDNKESLFPDEEARGRYGLSPPEQALNASALHHLRTPPPVTLLIHGEKDILTHYSQSVKFAENIKASGGTAKLLLFPDLNHSLINPNNPDAFKKATLQIARLYKNQFKLKHADIDEVESLLDQRLAGFYPAKSIETDQLLGVWKCKKYSVQFKDDGTAEMANANGKVILTGKFRNQGDFVEVITDEEKRFFYLRKDGRAVFEIYREGRFAGKKEVYTKRR